MIDKKLNNLAERDALFAELNKLEKQIEVRIAHMETPGIFSKLRTIFINTIGYQRASGK